LAVLLLAPGRTALSQHSPLLFSGNSNPQLAEEIAKRLRLHVGKALVSEFKNEETRVEIRENVRGSEVFVMQSICKTPSGKGLNDALMELLLMIDALRRASAARITAVIPYYGYAKQDKKTKGREPISAKVVANLLKTTGARRIVTMDLHAAQIQGFFDIPVDNLEAKAVLCDFLKKEGLCDDKIVVVSPDAGGVHRAETFAKRLNSSLAIVFKRRPEPDISEVTDIVGDVAGRVAVVVDDMISTGGTLAKAAEAIKARGATKVYTVATHGIFAGDAVKVLEQSEIERVLFTNTIPFESAEKHPKFVQLSIAQTFADAINRITTNRSVSELFAGDETPNGLVGAAAEAVAVS
jgi:ribose-phosphate pyrophosphokinase